MLLVVVNFLCLIAFSNSRSVQNVFHANLTSVDVSTPQFKAALEQKHEDLVEFKNHLYKYVKLSDGRMYYIPVEDTLGTNYSDARINIKEEDHKEEDTNTMRNQTGSTLPCIAGKNDSQIENGSTDNTHCSPAQLLPKVIAESTPDDESTEEKIGSGCFEAACQFG